MHKLTRKFKTQSLLIDNKTTHTYTINTTNNQHIQPPITNTQLSTKGIQRWSESSNLAP